MLLFEFAAFSECNHPKGSKSNNMKGLAIGTAAVFTSLTLIGGVFKMMHWPGANIGLVIGIVGLAIISVPLISIYKYRSTS